MRDRAVQRHTDLLIRVVSNAISGDPALRPSRDRADLVGEFDRERRENGRDWPSVAHSMAGLRRLTSLRDLVQQLLDEGVPGDLAETGVWRGGCCILMRGVLRANGVGDRRVWACDSVEGLPRPDPAAFPPDDGDPHHAVPALAAPLVRCGPTSRPTASPTTRCASCPASSATRCRGSTRGRSRSSGSTGTCTRAPRWRSTRSIRGSRAGAWW